MGFSSGPMSFRRYFLCGEHPRAITEDWLERLGAGSFGRQREVHPDGIETGWIVPTQLFDVDFSRDERVTVGRFVYVALRVDRTAPPANIVRSYRKLEEQAMLAASGRDYLNAAERRQAREAGDARAAEEARGGMFRRTAAYPLAIDLEDGVAYFGNHGSTANDKLMALFADTFGVSIVPAGTDEVAFRLAEKLRVTRAFEDVVPSHFVKAPTAFESSDASGLADNDRRFLGREFLTWLWYQAETHEGLCGLGQGRSAALAIDRHMHLVCGFDIGGTVTIRSDAPAGSPEAQAALRTGKLPTKMHLLVEAQGEAWGLTLDGLRWDVSGLTFAPSEDEAPEDRLLNRFMQMREASRVVDGLLRAFLQCRLRGGWRETHKAMSRWAGRNGKASDSPVKLATA